MYAFALTAWLFAPPAMAKKPCPDGQVRTADTRNHCCWEGQRWDTAAKACAGRPTACPQGLLMTLDPEDATRGSCTELDLRSLIGAKGVQLGSGPALNAATMERVKEELADPAKAVTLVPGLAIGAPVMQGSLDRDGVDARLRAAGANMGACADRLRAKDPTRTGKLVVKLDIRSDGTVVAATTLLSTLGDPDTEACLTKAMDLMDFPSPDSGDTVVVAYPLFIETLPP